jgi:hypothetical protein
MVKLHGNLIQGSSPSMVNLLIPHYLIIDIENLKVQGFSKTGLCFLQTINGLLNVL